MSERKNQVEDITQLKKKTSRKKKILHKLEKDFDINKFKDKVFSELANETTGV